MYVFFSCYFWCDETHLSVLSRVEKWFHVESFVNIQEAETMVADHSSFFLHMMNLLDLKFCSNTRRKFTNFFPQKGSLYPFLFHHSLKYFIRKCSWAIQLYAWRISIKFFPSCFLVGFVFRLLPIILCWVLSFLLLFLCLSSSPPMNSSKKISRKKIKRRLKLRMVVCRFRFFPQTLHRLRRRQKIKLFLRN